MTTRSALASRLPDLPRWVEVRDLLLHGEPDILGFEDGEEPAFALLDRPTRTLFVIGAPSCASIERAAVHGDVREVIATRSSSEGLAAVLPRWRESTILVHELRDDLRLPRTGEEVAFIAAESLASVALPGDLREELAMAAEHSPIAASFVGAAPVAFCYAGATTESLWDVSIDTLEAHRRRGHGARCAAFFVRHMRAAGREPVWQSAEDNPASWKLAARLGFVVVDALTIWTPPEG